MRRVCSFCLVLFAALPVLSGCGGGTANGSGIFKIFLADTPMVGVESVDIKIDRVEAHLDGQWHKIGGELPMINLLDLRQESMLIASSATPSGTYTQIRLVVSEATITNASGTHNIRIPSNLQSGISIDIVATVAENTVTEVLLDFNVPRSIVQESNGTYVLEPFIPGVIRNRAGTVSGTVTYNGEPIEGAIITATYTEGSSYALGTVVNSAATADDGTFKVWALREGAYLILVDYTDGAQSLFEGGVGDAVVVRETDNSLGELELEEISP